MLYLDSSALMKHYVQEKGSVAFEQRLQNETSNSRPLFTSAFTYTEMHAALARRARERLFTAREFKQIREQFDSEWLLSYTPIEIGASVLGFIRDIVSRNPLKAADAIHLATAMSLRDTVKLRGKAVPRNEKIVFVTSDKQLAGAVLNESLEVFNPENQP